jgi:hypothetical protein
MFSNNLNLNYYSIIPLDTVVNHLDTGNSVNTNNVITVSSKENGSISRPRKAVDGRDLAIFILFRTERINNNLGLQIPNLDAIVGCGAQPVTVRRKAKIVNDFTSIKAVKTLAFVQVPKHGSPILSSRSTEGTIWRNTDSVEVSSVSDKVVTELAVGQSPNLDQTIPSTRDNEWNRLRRRETNARDPFGVAVFALSDSVLALAQSVPQLDSLVAGSRNNLTIVNGKGNRENILLVTNETTSGLSGVDFPKTEGSCCCFMMVELENGQC